MSVHTMLCFCAKEVKSHKHIEHMISLQNEQSLTSLTYDLKDETLLIEKTILTDLKRQ